VVGPLTARARRSEPGQRQLRLGSIT